MEPKFSGTVGQIFIFCLWMPILAVISLGFAMPFLVCTLARWVCEKSVISGKHYRFNGTAGALFGNWIKWMLLSIVTFGIYGFWATRNMIRWVVDNIEMIG